MSEVATKNEWIEAVTHSADGKALEAAVIDRQAEWQSLPKEVLKDIGMAMLAPRLHPQGSAFVKKHLVPLVRDPSLSNASAMVETNPKGLVTFLISYGSKHGIESIIHDADGSVVVAAPDPHVLSDERKLHQTVVATGMVTKLR